MIDVMAETERAKTVEDLHRSLQLQIGSVFRLRGISLTDSGYVDYDDNYISSFYRNYSEFSGVLIGTEASGRSYSGDEEEGGSRISMSYGISLKGQKSISFGAYANFSLDRLSDGGWVNLFETPQWAEHFGKLEFQ